MKILSIARALPSRRVTNDELVELALERASGNGSSAAQLDSLETTIRELLARTGARTRFHRAPGERAFDFGVAAGRAALDRAELGPESVDLLIYAGIGRGFLEPATANVFQDAIGAVNATCFDVLDACASWIRAVDVAHALIAAGQYRIAMILNCEFNFREYYPDVMNSELQELASIFSIGEAATATVLTGDARREFRATFRNVGRGSMYCQIPLPHAKEYLDGSFQENWLPLQFYTRPAMLHKLAIDALAEQYASDAAFSRYVPDIVFGHSVGVWTSQLVGKKLGLDPAKHYEIFPEYGNTVSASLPLAMSLAIDAGTLSRGSRVLGVVGSAGVTTSLAKFTF